VNIVAKLRAEILDEDRVLWMPPTIDIAGLSLGRTNIQLSPKGRMSDMRAGCGLILVCVGCLNKRAARRELS
jgi:hypothetical protein